MLTPNRAGRIVRPDPKPLSARTVLHHHRVLYEALRHAVQWQLLSRNPADGVKPPRPGRHEIRVITAEEAGRLMAAASDATLHMLVYLALTTGARQGELLALRWQDVDLERGVLHVVRTARRLPGRGTTYGAPKSHRSERPVALAPETLRLLHEHRRKQVEERLRVGPDYEDGDLVFATATGTPVDDSNLRRWFQRVLKEAGLKPMRFHDLRHTAATLMLRADIHPKVVSERLGHATVSFTLDTYSHVLPDMQRDAAVALDRMLQRPPAPRSVGT